MYFTIFIIAKRALPLLNEFIKIQKMIYKLNMVLMKYDLAVKMLIYHYEHLIELCMKIDILLYRIILLMIFVKSNAYSYKTAGL